MVSPDELKAIAARMDDTFLQIVLLSLIFLLIFASAWAKSDGFRQRVKSLERFDVFARISPHISIGTIMVIGAAMRIPRLFDSLWYDEAFTARMISLPLEQMPAAIMSDVHPPLWYVIQKAFAVVFGTSEAALRLPALIFGVALIWLVYQLAQEIEKRVLHRHGNIPFSDTFALVAAALVAVLPSSLYYSSEARAYALMGCLGVVMVWAVLQDRRWVFAASGVMIALTHNLGYFYLPVMSLAVLCLYRKSWRGWIVPMAVMGIGAAMWIPFLLDQARYVSDGYWTHQITLGGVLFMYIDMTTSRQLMEVFILPAFLLIIGVSVVAVVFSLAKFASRAWIPLIALTFGVPGLIALVSALWYPIYLGRALLACGMGLAIFWAFLVTHAPLRRVARVALAPALVMALISFYNPDISRAHMREMASVCDGATAAYATSIPAAFFASYYVDAPLYVWSQARDLGYTLDDSSKVAFGFDLRDQPPPGACIVTLEVPTTSDAEHDHVASIGGEAVIYEISQFYHVEFRRI